MMSHADEPPAAGPDPHPTPETLAAFLADRLTPAELDALEPHIAVCPTCCTILRQFPADPLARKLRAQHATDGGSRDDTPSTAGPGDYLAILAPAQESGELGRLGHYRVLRLLGAG